VQNVLLEGAKIQVCDMLSVLKLLFVNKNIKNVFCRLIGCIDIKNTIACFCAEIS
jgi:hypothetical protein